MPRLANTSTKTATASAATPTIAAADRRVLRTREALRIALMRLMVEVGWDSIEVQTLCTRANVGRSTFYQHFLNKEELLVSSLGDLQAALLQSGRALHNAPGGGGDGAHGGLRFVPGLLEHAYESQEVFRAVLGRRSAQFVQDRFREMLVQLVLKEPRPSGMPAWQHTARAHCTAGSLMELMAWWLGVKRLQKPVEIAAVFFQWMAPENVGSEALVDP